MIGQTKRQPELRAKKRIRSKQVKRVELAMVHCSSFQLARRSLVCSGRVNRVIALSTCFLVLWLNLQKQITSLKIPLHVLYNVIQSTKSFTSCQLPQNQCSHPHSVELHRSSSITLHSLFLNIKELFGLGVRVWSSLYILLSYETALVILATLIPYSPLSFPKQMTRKHLTSLALADGDASKYQTTATAQRSVTFLLAVCWTEKLPLLPRVLLLVMYWKCYRVCRM